MIAKHKKRFLTSLGFSIPMIVFSMFFIYEPDPEIQPTFSEVLALAFHIAGQFLLSISLFYLAKAKGYPGVFGPLAVLFLGNIGFLVALFAPDKTQTIQMPNPEITGI